MKNAAKFIAAALFVSFATACAPSADALCDHVIEVTKKEAGDEIAKAIDKADCVKSAEKKKEMKGLIKYNEQAKCIMAAETLEAIGACK